MKTKHFLTALTVGVTFVTGFSTPAEAATVIFTYDGTIDTWVVPDTGVYAITAYGAQGGNALEGFGFGGLGAEIKGSLMLPAGTVLSILVGGSGVRGQFGGQGSGGGGSFVVGPGNTPLIIAGGGGGGSGNTSGGAGQTGTAGGGPLAGTDGSGGAAFGGAGGGGFFGDGQDNANGGYGGKAFIHGGQGGGVYILGAAPGGFGGGGASKFLDDGGGGGGYSGGGGGYYDGVHGQVFSGGGGGSFLAADASNTINASGVRTGNGLITIEQVSSTVPEPSTWMMLGIGIPALLSTRRYRNA